MNSRQLMASLARKTLVFIAMMFLLSLIVFYVSRLTPGDPLQSFYGDAMQSMTTTELDAARERLGLNGPIWMQYAKWIGNVMQGDFGISLKYKRPVPRCRFLRLSAIRSCSAASPTRWSLCSPSRLPSSAPGSRTLSWIGFVCRIGTVAFYVPAFWMGVVLVLVFSVNLKLLPSSGAYGIGKSGDLTDRLRHLVLPLIVMVASHLWYYAYMIRNKLLDEIRRDYVLLARAKGLGRTRVLLSHCLRNVLPTIVSIMAISIPHVLSGTYVAESVFNYPGIGLLAVSSAKYHDYNLLMLMVLITGAMVMLSSLVAQAVNEVIDPRMKSSDGVVC